MMDSLTRLIECFVGGAITYLFAKHEPFIDQGSIAKLIANFNIFLFEKFFFRFVSIAIAALLIPCVPIVWIREPYMAGKIIFSLQFLIVIVGFSTIVWNSNLISSFIFQQVFNGRNLKDS